MSNKRIFPALIVTAVLVFSRAGGVVQTAAEKAAAAKPQKLLIRMDLLQKKGDHTAEARRDLFSPQAAVGAEDVPAVMPNVNPQKVEENAASGESQPSSVILHYIGHIYNETKKKYVALVFFEEQVTAVQEGDLLRPGWKIVKITAKELEVEGPDKKSQTFSIEGEQR